MPRFIIEKKDNKPKQAIEKPVTASAEAPEATETKQEKLQKPSDIFAATFLNSYEIPEFSTTSHHKQPQSLAVLVAIKDLTSANTRLSPFLDDLERKTLAHLMLEWVLLQLSQLPSSVRCFLVTSYKPAIQLAARWAFPIIEEPKREEKKQEKEDDEDSDEPTVQKPLDENSAVDHACQYLEAQGYHGVLRLPLDLPCLRTEDILEVLTHAWAGESVILVPAHDNKGTNAVYRNPPSLFPSHFGIDSLQAHISVAEAAGCKPLVLNNKAIALDIDEPEDLRQWLNTNMHTPAWRYLKSLSVENRLANPPTISG